MTQDLTKSRLLSLDFMRGLIMVLLMLESVGLYENLHRLRRALVFNFFLNNSFIIPGMDCVLGSDTTWVYVHGRNGDGIFLTSPASQGVPWRESFIKVLKRSVLAIFLGRAGLCCTSGGLSFELWDVLTQLSVTTLIAFFIFRWSYSAQIAFSLGTIGATELLYRYTNIPNFDQPFTDQHNFGNYMDLVLMNKINEGGWVAINCIPTAAAYDMGCVGWETTSFIR
jgi:hypothetical protein